jgi:hypothetical protein
VDLAISLVFFFVEERRWSFKIKADHIFHKNAMMKIALLSIAVAVFCIAAANLGGDAGTASDKLQAILAKIKAGGNFLLLLLNVSPPFLRLPSP